MTVNNRPPLIPPRTPPPIQHGRAVLIWICTCSCWCGSAPSMTLAADAEWPDICQLLSQDVMWEINSTQQFVIISLRFVYPRIQRRQPSGVFTGAPPRPSPRCLCRHKKRELRWANMGHVTLRQFPFGRRNLSMMKSWRHVGLVPTGCVRWQSGSGLLWLTSGRHKDCPCLFFLFVHFEVFLFFCFIIIWTYSLEWGSHDAMMGSSLDRNRLMSLLRLTSCCLFGGQRSEVRLRSTECT